MLDTVRLAYWFGLLTALLGLVCLIWVVRANAGSRTLVLGVGTLAGAFILFALQLIFELQGTTTTDAFGAEYTLDHAVPEIRRPAQNVHMLNSIFVESQANNTLATSNPAAFKEDADKLIRDLTIFSLLGYISSEHFDWQLRQARFKSQLGVAVTSSGVSKPDECTNLSEDQLREKLEKVDNAFAGTHSFTTSRGLCLPPDASIVIEMNRLRVITPICEILFAIDVPFVHMHHLEPGSSDTSRMPLLADGKPRFDTILVAVHATVTFNAYRAQNWDLKKYQDWSSGVIEGARRWFEGA